MEINNDVNDTLISGSESDDTIVNSGSNVTINSGSGKDSISLEYDGLEYVALSSVSSETVSGFETGTNSTSDVIYLTDGSLDSLTVVTVEGGVEVNNAGGKLILSEATASDTMVVMDLNGNISAVQAVDENSTVETYNNTLDNILINGNRLNNTITNTGSNVTIDGGKGNDLVSLNGGSAAVIISSGYNTVIGFGTSDTLVFADGVKNKAVGFTDEGLYFETDTVMGGSDYLKVDFVDISDTTLINLKYGSDTTEKVALINDGDIYNVTDGAADEYIGAVATSDQGISFDGVNGDINITLESANDIAQIWNIHSVIGGDGNTTMAGSDSDDTIKAGSGKTTIIGSDGEDVLIGNGNTTFIINSEVLTAASETSTATVYTSEDGTATVIGTGDWQVNGSTVTLSNVASLRSTDNGFEVYDAGTLAYEAAIQDLTEDKVHYDNGSSDVNIAASNDGGEALIIGINATGNKIITAGESGDSLENYSKTANVTIEGGIGDDYIVVTSGSNEHVDLSKGGADTIVVANSDTVNIYGYDAKTGSTFLTNTDENLTNLIMYGEPYLLIVGDGYFKPANLGKVVLADMDTLKGTFVNFTVIDEDTTQLYGWSGQAGGLVDGRDYVNDEIIIGIAPDGHSSLVGGEGDDTIYAGSGDIVSLSSGIDVIVADHRTEERSVSGAITISAEDDTVDADTTITNFDATSDEIVISNIDDLSFNYDNGSLQLIFNNSVLTFSDVTESTSLIVNDTLKGFIANDDTLSVGDGSLPAEFINEGESAAVDFSAYTSTLNIDLNDTKYQNITTVKGGAGDTTLWGSDDTENALHAGSGGTAIFGGFDSTGDSLVGYSGDDKKAGTNFFVVANSGSDTLYNFEFGTSATSDKLWTFGLAVNKVESEGNSVKFQIYDDTNEAVIDNALNKVIQVSAGGVDWVIEYGEDLTYNESVNFYSANSAATLTIGSDVTTSNVEIWSNGADGKFYNNIKDINASGYVNSAILVGNDMENVITSSNGGSKLWGGEGSENDTLIGGSGSDEFFYLKGNGDDVVQNASSGDIINLLNITLSDMTLATITSSGVNFEFNDGGKLSIETTSDLTFKLGDGSTYKSNHNTREFTD